MKAIFVAIAVSGTMLWTCAIAAGCHFKSKLAIVCSGGHDAVDAFDLYGFDADRMAQSYSRYALAQARCFLAPGNAKIKQFSHGRVTYTDGWRGATVIEVNGKGDGVVADEYLEGKCEKYVPIVQYVNPESAMRIDSPKQ